jgi:RNA polymerase sigma-70 factor (ECF subfamily)
MHNWPQILEHEGPAVWRSAYRILGNYADAEEVYQEAFLAAVKVVRREPVLCWRALLQRLSIGSALDRLRQRSRRQAHEAAADWDSFPASVPAPVQEAEANELLERLREALCRLPPRQSEVFCLHCLEGWSYQEISKQLKTPIDTVGVLLLRARQKLRELLPAVSS